MLKRPKSLSLNSGVYIFHRAGTPLYVGKALNLKKRLASYFQKNSGMSTKIQKMLAEATRLETIETDSEIEALIKETELIKKYRPKYNVLMRDDKSYFYVAITRDKFPRIFVTHQPRREIRNPKSEIPNKLQIRNSKRVSNFVLRASNFRYIGPFTSGGDLRRTLKLLRRVFPYCTCLKPHTRPCLSSQIGLCPGYCCVIGIKKKELRITKYQKEYRTNINKIIAILSGNRTRLVSTLKKQMREAARKEHYEDATRIRDQLFGMEDVFSHRMVLRAPEDGSVWQTTLGHLQRLLKTEKAIERIEGYDIATISGTAATGSMVVFTNGRPDKAHYRKFKIKTVRGQNDVAMLKEVILRRLHHAEWQFPQLIVIDGGKPQLGTALSVLREFRSKKQELKSILVTALAKKEEVLYTERGNTLYLKRGQPELLHLFQRIRDESHRFARAYHHRLRRRSYADS